MGLIIASPGWAAVRFKSVDTDKTFETVPNKCYLLLPPSLSSGMPYSHPWNMPCTLDGPCSLHVLPSTEVKPGQTPCPLGRPPAFPGLNQRVTFPGLFSYLHEGNDHCTALMISNMWAY